MSDPIYFVTVFSLPVEYRDRSSKKVKWNDKPEGWESYLYKRSRCWGWYRDIEAARKCIAENWTDIYENAYYDLAMIEPMHEGIARCVHGDDEWYNAEPQLNSDGFITGYTVSKIDKPRWLESIIGFSYA